MDLFCRLISPSRRFALSVYRKERRREESTTPRRVYEPSNYADSTYSMSECGSESGRDPDRESSRRQRANRIERRESERGERPPEYARESDSVYSPASREIERRRAPSRVSSRAPSRAPSGTVWGRGRGDGRVYPPNAYNAEYRDGSTFPCGIFKRGPPDDSPGSGGSSHGISIKPMQHHLHLHRDDHTQTNNFNLNFDSRHDPPNPGRMSSRSRNRSRNRVSERHRERDRSRGHGVETYGRESQSRSFASFLDGRSPTTLRRSGTNTGSRNDSVGGTVEGWRSSGRATHGSSSGHARSGRRQHRRRNGGEGWIFYW